MHVSEYLAFLAFWIAFSRFEFRSEFLQLSWAEQLAHFRKHLFFFLLLSMMLDVFFEYLELRLEFLTILRKAIHFSQQSLNLLMLFDGFENHVSKLFVFLHGGIENSLFDPRV